MASFLDDLLKKMKTAPHVGVPSVTNPKLPTKVERETAEYAARQKAMPKFNFGTGTPLEKLQERMANAPHPTPTKADPSFTPNNAWEALGVDVDTFDAELEKFVAEVKAKKISTGNP